MENGQKKEHLIESVCVDIGRELNRRGFTRTTEAFLQAHGEELMRNIGDNRLRESPYHDRLRLKENVMRDDMKRRATPKDDLINEIVGSGGENVR